MRPAIHQTSNCSSPSSLTQGVAAPGFLFRSMMCGCMVASDTPGIIALSSGRDRVSSPEGHPFGGSGIMTLRLGEGSPVWRFH
jgi:hypothetical protein